MGIFIVKFGPMIIIIFIYCKVDKCPGSNWGQQKETLLMAYKALGRSIANYAAPIWSTNACELIGPIQHAQNETLRIITGSHKMSSIDHLHSGTDTTHGGPLEPSFCAMSGYRERLSPHHQDGSSTQGNEGGRQSSPDIIKPCYHC